MPGVLYPPAKNSHVGVSVRVDELLVGEGSSIFHVFLT